MLTDIPELDCITTNITLKHLIKQFKYSVARIIPLKIRENFVLINRVCKLKGQFNTLSLVYVQDNDANYLGGAN